MATTTNNDVQNTTQKTKDRATQTPLKNLGWHQMLWKYWEYVRSCFHEETLMCPSRAHHLLFYHCILNVQIVYCKSFTCMTRVGLLSLIGLWLLLGDCVSIFENLSVYGQLVLGRYQHRYFDFWFWAYCVDTNTCTIWSKLACFLLDEY